MADQPHGPRQSHGPRPPRGAHRVRHLTAVAGVAVVVAIAVAGCSATGSSTPATSGPQGSHGGGPTTTAPTTTTPTTTTTAPAAPVPAAYTGMVQGLDTELDTYQSEVAAMPDYRASDHWAPAFVPAAELLDANGNRQAQLLQPGALAQVDQELDSLKRLGVTGVTIGIKLPLLLSSFTPQAARYADFYASVAQQARARGFTIDVELGALFCGTVFSTCSYAYPTTVAGWAQLTAEQARIVIDRVHPRFLDIMSEPNTEADLTSIRGLETLDGVAQFVSATLAQIGPHGSTMIGAGAASWFPVSYDEAIARTDVDVLIDHVYPLTPAVLGTLVATAALAHQVHKPLVVDEAWLYKGSTTASGTVTSSGGESKLDAFSFFQPLDVRFMSITRQWSTKADVAFTSPFWSTELFGYVTWTPGLDAGSVAQTLALEDQAAVAAMGSRTVSASGAAWGRPS